MDYKDPKKMTHKEYREYWLSTHRTPEYLEKRKQRKLETERWKNLCEKYDLDHMTVEERYNVLVQEGYIDPSITLESILEKN